MQFYPAFRVHLPVCDYYFHHKNCLCPPEKQLSVSHTSMGIPQFSSWCVTLLPFAVHQRPPQEGEDQGKLGRQQSTVKPWAWRSCTRGVMIPNNGNHRITSQQSFTALGSQQHSHADKHKKMRIRRAVVMETHLHSAFDQIKGNNCCMCSATT